MIEAAERLGDYAIVIVNNDKQQLMKKGKIIMDEAVRFRVVSALKAPDEVILSIDETKSVAQTLRMIREKYPDDELIFGNGGDRVSDDAIPEDERLACEECNIERVYGIAALVDSSSRINEALGR